MLSSSFGSRQPFVRADCLAETVIFASAIVEMSMGLFLIFVLYFTHPHVATANDAKVFNKDPLSSLNWLKGVWRAEYSGKVFWPTIPTMTFGEELIIQEAPVSVASGMRFLNFSARAWSHTTLDHLHDEWGYITVDPTGKVVLMTAGNNGQLFAQLLNQANVVAKQFYASCIRLDRFSTYEEGTLSKNTLKLRLADIGRVSFSRDLPVKELERTFTLKKQNRLEQWQRMRTATHPTEGLLDHAIVVYEKIA
ncbi:hypothetical protein D918_05627 [Trichuris suis]|nr:hypothetical protein D918_05627 [Trichuris suis]